MTESKMLLPYRWKKIGWFLLVPFFVLGLLYLVLGDDFTFNFARLHFGTNTFFSGGNWLFSLKNNDLTDEIISIGLIVGILLTAFSKEKVEDEWIARTRLDAMLWAVYLNTILLLLSIIFLYGDLFWQVMILNLFTAPLFFLLRFRYVLWQSEKENNNEIAL